MGDFVNAIRDYQAAVKTDPSYALAYYNAANVYFRQRQFKQVSWVRVLKIKRVSPLLTLRDLEADTELVPKIFRVPAFSFTKEFTGLGLLEPNRLAMKTC